jgi:FMN phosphatase YigB (HAD superfamily)
MFTVIEQTKQRTVFHGGELTRAALEATGRAQLYQTPDFLSSLTEEIEDTIQRENIELLSLDVFDTALLRNRKSEVRRFYEMSELTAALMAEKLGLEALPLDIFVARIQATKLCYRFSKPVRGCREGTLREIHEGVCRLVGAPREFAEQTIEVELGYEMRNLSPNPIVHALVNLAAPLALPIVFLSDMYIGREHIARLIENHFPSYFHPSDIYSSGDLKISKRSGLLFDHVAQERKVKPGRALHIGDNFLVDYLPARQRGWHALHLPHADTELDEINKDERTLYEKLEATGLVMKDLK